MGLDAAQEAAVGHFNGPAVVVAGPGSGKTTVITHRIKRLIELHGILPGQILVITFTNMAAREMQKRFLQLYHDGHGVTFGTFHAVFFSILKHSCHYSASDIIRPERAQMLIRRQLLAAGICVRDEQALIMEILSEISSVKAFNENLEKYEAVSCPTEVFHQIYDRYQQMLKDEHLLDFDDMTVYTEQLLSGQPHILKDWQEKFSYILVDEFQDIAPAQFRIIKQLAAAQRNLFVVGDDDQSIYGFRGAAPGILQQFLEDYEHAAVYRLEVNYRSSANIVSAAKLLIEHNQIRFYKDLRTDHPAGVKIEVHEFEDLKQESSYIADEITDRAQSGQLRGQRSQEACAILTRMHNGSVQLKRQLSEKGACVFEDKKENCLYDHWITQDLTAYLRVAAGGRSRLDFLRILNRPDRQIDRQYFMSREVDLRQIENSMIEGGENAMAVRWERMSDDIKHLSGIPVFAAVNFIRKGIGYDRYIYDMAKEHKIDKGVLIEILDRLLESAASCDTVKQWEDRLREQPQSRGETVGKRNRNTKALPAPEVFVHTMHSAKGLEYDTVYLPDSNEGIAPYAKAVLDSELEEERRLFYVAMTRARKRLVLCYVRQHYNKQLLPSRFIREMQAAGCVDLISHVNET